MWDDVVDLFADNGVVEIGGQGVWRGKAGVRRWLETMGPAGLSHGQINDRVQFDLTVTIAPGGNEAWARGIELGTLGEADKEQGFWEVSTFRNRFVREGGVWKLRELRRFPLMKADTFRGWGTGRIVDAAPTGTGKPDAQVPAADAVDPRLAMPAFLGLHPVTGKPVAAAGSAKPVARTPLTGAIPSAKVGPIDLAEATRRLARSNAFDGVNNVSAAYGHFLDDENPAGFIGVLATKGFKGGRTGYYVTRASNIRARVSGPPVTVREGVSYHWLLQPVVLGLGRRPIRDRTPASLPAAHRQVCRQGRRFPRCHAPGQHLSRPLCPRGRRLADLGPDRRRAISGARRLQGRPVGEVEGSAAARSQYRPRAPVGRGVPNDITAADLNAKPDGLSWPSIKPMWFSYTNPVSGRVPPLYQPDCVPCTIRPDLKLSANGYQETPDAPQANKSP